jgi:hypothetical protein
MIGTCDIVEDKLFSNNRPSKVGKRNAGCQDNRNWSSFYAIMATATKTKLLSLVA